MKACKTCGSVRLHRLRSLGLLLSLFQPSEGFELAALLHGIQLVSGCSSVDEIPPTADHLCDNPAQDQLVSLAMPFDDPGRLDLGVLFRDEDMFDSRRSWSDAGFRVIDRSNNGKIMVASHPSVQGLLFKKYTRDIAEKDQTKNFERRLEGADRLRSFAEARRLSHIVVPHKWILELPRPFSRGSHVLLAEQLDLLSDDQTKAAYRRIDPNVLGELCVVLFHFRGMDSIAKNIPFVADGRIGFIDTEHWDRSTSKPYLHRVGEHLSKDRKTLAKKILGQLEDGDDVDVGDFRHGDFDDEEDTSDSSDDFADEEDTSSSSSSS